MVENPKAFEAYPANRFIEIVKAWANHSWPITAEEARELYESLGYRAKPSDPSLFISDLSADGEPDSYYTSIDNNVNSIRLAIARRCPDEDESKYSSLVSKNTPHTARRSRGPSTILRTTHRLIGQMSGLSDQMSGPWTMAFALVLVT